MTPEFSRLLKLCQLKREARRSARLLSRHGRHHSARRAAAQELYDLRRKYAHARALLLLSRCN